jgi:hypothetical protein
MRCIGLRTSVYITVITVRDLLQRMHHMRYGTPPFPAHPHYPLPLGTHSPCHDMHVITLYFAILDLRNLRICRYHILVVVTFRLFQLHNNLRLSHGNKIKCWYT